MDAGTHFRAYWGAIAEGLGGTYERGSVERLSSERGGWPLTGILKWSGDREAAEAEARRLKGVPSGCVWYTWPDDPAWLMDLLDSAGFQRLPGFRTVDLPMPDLPRAKTCARMAEGDDVVAGAEVQMIAHEIPPFARDEFVADAVLFDERDDAATFVADHDGQVAAVARAFIADDTIGVYGAGVLPDARRKGLGRAVSLAAVQWGAERGCDRIVGATTDLGGKMASSLGAPEGPRIGQFALMPSGPPPGASEAR